MAAPLTRWEQREGDSRAAKDDESLHDGSLPCVSSTGLEAASSTLVRTSSRSRSGDADRPTGKTNHLRAFVRAGSNFSTATATSAVSDDNDELLPSQISRSQMIRMYLADESSNRLVGNMAVLCGLISLTVLLVLAYRTDWWKGIRGSLRRHKDDKGWVLLSLLVEMVFVAVPLPGRGIWTMLVGHEYGYIRGFSIVIIGMLVGSSLAFVAARQISQRLCAGDGDREEWRPDSRICCCGRRGRWHRLLDLVITSMEVLEEQPLRSVSLLSLSVPPSLMSWALGANTSSSKLPIWRFLVGSLPGCITQIIPIHLGASLHPNDIEKLLAGKCTPENIWRIVSVIFAVCTSIAVGRIAWQRLKQDSEANCRYQHIETGSGSLTLSLCRG